MKVKKTVTPRWKRKNSSSSLETRRSRRSKITFIIACMLLLAHTGFSQINIDSLLQHQPQSQSYLIDKARNVLIDAFVQNDKQKVQELHRYLLDNFDQNNYVTLFPGEQILLYAWSGDFERMLQCIKELNEEYIAQMRKKIMPISDNNFYQTAKERVQQESETILDNLQSSSLTQEEKDFTAIYLHYFLISNENRDTTIRKINSDTRTFITTYPNSEYIKLFDSYELKPANWGWGIGVDFGYNLKTGSFSEYFKNGGFIDLYIDVAYKKIMITTGLGGTFGNARKDIVLSKDVILPQKMSGGGVTNFYLSLGYRFFDNKRVIVTPIAGIGSSWIKMGTTKEREDDPALKQFDHSYGLTANFGVMADIRLDKMKNLLGQNFADPSFFAIRLSYRFLYNNLTHTPIIYNGNMHTITVGFNLFGRMTNRVNYEHK